MSDIDLRFTWWQIALFQLALGFWPLTLVALAAAILAWRRRASRVLRIVAIVAGGFWIASAGLNLSLFVNRALVAHNDEEALRARQTTLAQSAVLAGLRLPPGTVVTRGSEAAPDDVAELDLPSATEIGGVPLVGHVRFSSGALDGDVTLARDFRIGGIPCSAGEPVRLRSGKLLGCRLAEPTRVKAIPCMGNIDVEQGVVCTLSADYSRFGFIWRAQTKLTDYGDEVWFRTGSLAPSLEVFESPLGPDSEVAFERGNISSVDLQSGPMRFRGCAIDLILIRNRAVSGRAAGPCSLPALNSSVYVALPPTAVRARGRP